MYVSVQILISIFSEGPPRWGRRMTDLKLIARPVGGTVEMKCPAEGKPYPSIDWLKNGIPFTKREMGPVSSFLFYSFLI